MKLPISELFESVQGEGVFTGTPMYFIRFAGCNVGQYTDPVDVGDPHLRVLRTASPRHSICTSALGQSFLCDTDYHSFEKLEAEELIERIPKNIEHVCITGGEPFMHDWIAAFHKTITARMPVQVHFETSGTKLIPPNVADAWITCSPKIGFLPENRIHVDEYKFVVDAGRDEGEMIRVINEVIGYGKNTAEVFLQPINDLHQLSQQNIQYILGILRQKPSWRLSVQMHKVIGAR